jgi:hypothetical protein
VTWDHTAGATLNEGNFLESHADVPRVVRQQLYAEQLERLHKQHKTSTGNASSLPPITINNVLPGSASSASGTQAETAAATASASGTSVPQDFELPGFRDVALNEYSKWHQSRVLNSDLKADFRKAEAVTSDNALDLDLIYEENDPDFFEKQGVKRGTAKRWVRDIPRWAKRYKADDAKAMSLVP